MLTAIKYVLSYRLSIVHLENVTVIFYIFTFDLDFIVDLRNDKRMSLRIQQRYD